jgi:phosphoribosylamine-glycine ligase
MQTAQGSLDAPPPTVDDVAVCVVLAAAGYPVATETGAVVGGLDRAVTVEGVTIFHAGTRRDTDGTLRVAGGRVLALTALGPTIGVARSRVYAAVDDVHFDGMQFRRDIAATSDRQAAAVLPGPTVDGASPEDGRTIDGASPEDPASLEDRPR